ncbi:MAG: hypothetical protein A4E57_03417 [Syntrophorhabdaceae bacterium PtaU1.Bin034]|nr:MAG: hypothetical protein A4E57_03417 [Syntrophorhabdaceae bacterium PtaU1.Bin034]
MNFGLEERFMGPYKYAVEGKHWKSRRKSPERGRSGKGDAKRPKGARTGQPLIHIAHQYGRPFMLGGDDIEKTGNLFLPLGDAETQVGDNHSHDPAMTVKVHVKRSPRLSPWYAQINMTDG